MGCRLMQCQALAAQTHPGPPSAYLLIGVLASRRVWAQSVVESRLVRQP